MHIPRPMRRDVRRNRRGGPRRGLFPRLEEVAKAGGGGYRRLQTPLKLALGVRGTVAEHRLGALEGGGGGCLLHFRCIPAQASRKNKHPSRRLQEMAATGQRLIGNNGHHARSMLVLVPPSGNLVPNSPGYQGIVAKSSPHQISSFCTYQIPPIPWRWELGAVPMPDRGLLDLELRVGLREPPPPRPPIPQGAPFTGPHLKPPRAQKCSLDSEFLKLESSANRGDTSLQIGWETQQIRTQNTTCVLPQERPCQKSAVRVLSMVAVRSFLTILMSLDLFTDPLPAPSSSADLFFPWSR